MTPSLPEDSLVLLNDDSWWIGASVLDNERNFGSPLSFDATESGLFNGNFVPPPPRPPFLEEAAQSDGLTTCGMCSWATKNQHLLDTNSAIGGEFPRFFKIPSLFLSFLPIADPPGEWGFTVVMIVVSVISALIGAFVMVTVLKCRR